MSEAVLCRHYTTVPLAGLEALLWLGGGQGRTRFCLKYGPRQDRTCDCMVPEGQPLCGDYEPCDKGGQRC